MTAPDDELLDASPRALMSRVERGHPVAPDEVAGAVYRGISLGLPSLIERLSWKTFRKVFVRDPARGVRGWNERVIQDGLTAPTRPRMRGGRPWHFGHFAVLADAGSLLLDYGAAHPAWHPLARVRDPLVALEAGSADRLLGYSYLAIGNRRVATPSFFVLEREQPVAIAFEPPMWRR